MSNIELLDRMKHGSLRLSAPLGNARSFVQIAPDEIVEASARAPIFFTKDSATGHFYVGVMLGFKGDENLFQDPSGRMTGFLPLDFIRQGFFTSGEHIAIDPEDPRFAAAGEPLFGEDGTPCERLRQIQHVLGRVNRGLQESERFIAAMMKLHLFEPIDLSLRFDDGENISLRGLYTISLDTLHDLEDDQLLTLFRSGDLQLAYAIAHSLQQVRLLAEQRNRRLSESAMV